MPKEINEGFDITTPELLSMLTSEPPNTNGEVTDKNEHITYIDSTPCNQSYNVLTTYRIDYMGGSHKNRLCPFKAIGKGETDLHKRCTSNCMLFNHAKNNCNINVIAENIEGLHKWEITK